LYNCIEVFFNCLKGDLRREAPNCDPANIVREVLRVLWKRRNYSLSGPMRAAGYHLFCRPWRSDPDSDSDGDDDDPAPETDDDSDDGYRSDSRESSAEWDTDSLLDSLLSGDTAASAEFAW